MVPVVGQQLAVRLRKSFARPISQEALARHYAKLKSRHFGKQSQLDIGGVSVWDLYIGERPAGSRTEEGTGK